MVGARANNLKNLTLEFPLGRFIAATGADADRFRAAYALLGAQRGLRIMGIFTRLAQRDGKRRYLAFMPRVWDAIQRNLTHPALAPLAAALEAEGIEVFKTSRGTTQSHQFAIPAAPFGGGQAAAKKLRHANFLACGIGLLPESRKSEGLITAFSIRENISLNNLPKYQHASGLIDKARECASVEALMRQLSIKAPSGESLVVNLSGGNQQKVVIARWINHHCEIGRASCRERVSSPV